MSLDFQTLLAIIVGFLFLVSEFMGMSKRFKSSGIVDLLFNMFCQAIVSRSVHLRAMVEKQIEEAAKTAVEVPTVILERFSSE